jgi:transposase
MRFVAVKSQAQQDILDLHRVRALLIRERTAAMNQMRGLLAECGIVVTQGAAHLRRAVSSIREASDDRISEVMYRVLAETSERLRWVEQRLAGYDQQILVLVRASQPARRMMTVPGVGPLIATALLASVGDTRQFKSGRHLSGWLGLVPREYASGERKLLLGISKRGDRYLRTLLVHGARSTLFCAARKADRHSVWMTRLRERGGANVAAVALANKNARILWALLWRNEEYRLPAAAQAP